ncbi:MAG: VWA domain-containing protein [Anaerolineales bacterium]|nr:VWA domain-containing protein [Anaerolineales bacterium]
MAKYRVLVITLLVAGLFVWANPALADGIIIPDPPIWPEPPPLERTWLTIRYHRVSVEIEEQVAITRVEQEFVNEHEWEAEGIYVFPLPEGAAVSEFVMWVDGEPIEGKILEADEARAIYEDIVRRRRDPALLEYVGRGAIQARIFPIPPGGSRKIELEYTQVLPVENGLVRYTYPLNTEKFSMKPIEEVSVRVEIHSREAMRALYSPTHQDQVFIERPDEHHALVGYEESDVLPRQDFDLVYTVSQDEVGLNLLSYRDAPDDGFFLLLLAPTLEAEEGAIPKDVVLVLDTSGSMEGDKIEQAREALIYVLEHLNQEDRFNVVAFSTGLQQYGRGLRPASEASEAADWVVRLEAVGGTDINRALLEALVLDEGETSERPLVLIFLTDGLPTEGVTDVDQILSNVAATASERVRLFAFGVGDDVNTVLLDTLAQQQRGTVGYVRPHERIDEEVSALYAKISTPVLTNIGLEFDDVMVEELYPYPLPDLFAGTQLALVGRYRQGGHSRISLTGDVNGQPREAVYEGTFRESGGDNFIPRLWATRKIGHLLTEIRLHGEQREWVDAVVELSVQYGIITPYTSFLIDESDILAGDILSDEGREEAAEYLMEQPAPEVSGAPAAEAADEQAQMRGAESAGGAPLAPEAERVLRAVGSKTFMLQQGVWIDTRFDRQTMRTTPVAFGSEAYFDLLADHPEWGDYLALGDQVIFVAGEEIYEIVPGEDESESDQPDTPSTVTPAATPTPQDVDLPTPTPGPGTPTTGVCRGAMVLGVLGLGFVALWQRKLRL